MAEGGAIQAIWRPSSLDYNPGYLAATASRGSRSAVRLKQPELCSLELSVLAGRLEPWLVSAAAVRTARLTMLSCGHGGKPPLTRLTTFTTTYGAFHHAELRSRVNAAALHVLH